MTGVGNRNFFVSDCQATAEAGRSHPSTVRFGGLDVVAEEPSEVLGRAQHGVARALQQVLLGSVAREAHADRV